MNSRLFSLTLRQLQKFQTAGAHAAAGAQACGANAAGTHETGAGGHKFVRVGNREIVGFGFNGIPSYMDRVDFPMPAVRFREVTSDIRTLREKEKGSWKKLTLEEKKALYRASFCLTFAEIEAPTGEWKSVVGTGFLLMTVALWLVILEKLFIYKELPQSFSKESKEAQLRYMIAAEFNPVEGIASKWDYENDDWKK